MLMKSLRELPVMNYWPFTECQQIYNHAIYYFQRERLGKWAIWFYIVFHFHFKDFIEDELHVLTLCPLYHDLRDELYNKATSIIQSFTDLTDTDKVCFILSSNQIVKYTAKTCYNILVRRRSCIYNNVRCCSLLF